MNVNKSGVVLIMMIIFMIVAIISGFALYQTVGIFCKMQNDETRRIKADYIASSGIGYGQMLLSDPTVYLGFVTLDTSDSERATRHVSQSVNKPLADNLGIAGSGDLAVPVEERLDGKYNVTSVYTY